MTPIASATVRRWSAPFRGWHYHPEHVIPAEPRIEGVEGVHMTDVPTVFRLPQDPHWYLSFIGFDGRGYQTFIAQSEDLLHWSAPRRALGFGAEGEFDFGGRAIGGFLYEDYDLRGSRQLKRREGRFTALFLAFPHQGGYELRPGAEGLATSVDGLIWERARPEPILSTDQPDCGDWEKDCVYLPWLLEHEGRFYNFYNGAKGKYEQMGLAVSEDLIHWQRHPANPVVANGPSGSFNEIFSADGRVFRDGDHWTMFFFGVGQGGAHIMLAFSHDLVSWTVDPEPIYRRGGHPHGLDAEYAHKVSPVWNPANGVLYLFYNAVGKKGRGIGLLTSEQLS
ncbi:MAG: hypothetical protein ACLFR7_09330 [Opitutales bacterium]